MVLCCLLLVLDSFGDVSHYVCNIMFSSIWVSEWLPFGKELVPQLTICSL